MAIAHVSTGALAATSADTQVTVTLPSHSTDDLIIVFAGAREDSPVPALDVSGYTAIGSQALLDAGANGIALHAFYKFAASGAESDPTITGSGSTAGGCFGFAVVYSGVDQTTPLSGVTPLQGTNDAADQYTPPSITPDSASDRLVVSVVATMDDNALAIVTSQSFTTRASGVDYDTTVGADFAFAVTDKAVTQSTAVTLPTYDQTAVGTDQWAYKTFVLRPASGGSSDGTFSTTASSDTASGGSSSFTGTATFASTVGDAPAAGGSTAFTGGAAFATTVGEATADGGSSTFTGTAVFDTAAGEAVASGGSSSFTGAATFDTVVGEAIASGGSTTFDASSGADATFSTTAGDATASGGSSTFTGNGTFDTAGGTATASGGSTTLTGTATFDTTAADAPAAGGSSSFTGTAEFVTAVGEATASGGETTFVGDGGSVDAEFTSIVGELIASGGSTAFTGTDGTTGGGSSPHPGYGLEALFRPLPKKQQQVQDAVFGANAEPAVMVFSGSTGSMSGTTAYPLTTEGHNELVLELV